MVKCKYCKGEIPKGRYMLMRYKLGIDKGYCNEQCKNRAAILRAGVINKKYIPKNLNETDKKYVKDYINELSLTPKEVGECN